MRDISFSVYAGDRIAVHGASGSGKTLLLRTLAHLDPFDGGVFWQGHKVGGAKIVEFRALAILLAQRPSLPEGSVEDAIRQPLSFRANALKRPSDQDILDLLGRLGRNESFLAKETKDLSGGETQIVALVRALQLKPTLLFLDEPTSAIDTGTSTLFESLLSEWVVEGNRAFLWVTHDPAQQQRISSRRFHLENGNLMEESDG